jgi:hypothetical protein
MEDVGLLYGYLVHFVAILYILWLFAIFFSCFGMLYQDKSGNPAWKQQSWERQGEK